MKNKIFLSSMLIMSVAPAMAENFPSNGLMQENKTYDNAATSTNMDGVYEGTVNAVAEYDIIDYIVNAGQYLPADSETVITCPAGSYCPGISGNVQYNQSSDQGIQTCPTGYASSVAGASSDTQCYRQCSGNVTIAHATAVTGNDYYGAGVDTCEPTACENGWHVKQMNIASTIGSSDSAVSYASTNNNGQFKEYVANNGQSFYGLTNNNTWSVYYGSNKGMLMGQGHCSTQPGNNNNNQWTNPTIIQNLTDETGQTGAQYCYCNVTGYKDGNGNMQSLSSGWVFNNDGEYAADCALYCAENCSRNMGRNTASALALRAALLGEIESVPAMCEANVININWNDVDPATAGQNNENTATYGSDVRTPVKAATKKGQRFKGWRFSAPVPTSCQEIKDQDSCNNSGLICMWYNGVCTEAHSG